MSADVGFMDVMLTFGYALLVSAALGVFSALIFALWLYRLIIRDEEQAVVKRSRRAMPRQTTADVVSIHNRLARRKEEMASYR